MQTNRTVRLRRRPEGPVHRDDFIITDEPMETLQQGELRVQTTHVSLDPAMRGWMAEGRSYIRPIEIGGVIRSYSAGEVVESKHPAFPIGKPVTGVFGVQTHPVSDGKGVQIIDPRVAPAERWLGGLGMPGLTAYFGLKAVGEAQAGDTVVISGAAGAVGSIAGQLARNMGCRVVGIAGGVEKCQHVKDVLGFHECLDRFGDLKAQLKATCSEGVDVYFDNVGGPILELMLTRMNTFGRVSVCGLISQYNATEVPPGPRTFTSVLVRRLKVQGFIVFDFLKRYPEALRELTQQYRAGQLVMIEDVREHEIDAFPEVLAHLFTGSKLGKLILQLPK